MPASWGEFQMRKRKKIVDLKCQQHFMSLLKSSPLFNDFFVTGEKLFELKFDAGIGFVWMLSPDGKIIELVKIDPISIRFQINWEVKLSAEV